MNKLLALSLAAAGLAASMSASASIPTRLLGDPTTPDQATRTIVIGPSTRYVNVTGGEVVKFVSGDKTFTWNFDGLQRGGSFPLNQILPTGSLDHVVRAYVAPNPEYLD